MSKYKVYLDYPMRPEKNDLELTYLKQKSSNITYMGMIKKTTSNLMCLLMLLAGGMLQAQEFDENRMAVPIKLFNGFTALYKAELGSVKSCEDNVELNEYKVCSSTLRNEGNSPYILYAKATALEDGKRQQAPIVVLFHGLSDSPFFVRGIAEHLNAKGFTVVAPLSPGHGKRDATDDMKDPDLKLRWYKHVDNIMTLVKSHSDITYIGGFSTGGTLATRYMLQHPDEIDGLLLFSGALALSGSAENLARIWGMKSIAKLFDGDFISSGAHPYRYPDVAGYAGLLSADVIFEVRELLNENEVLKPIFAAHSMADVLAPYSGVESLMAKVAGQHHTITIDKSYDICHPDLVMSSMMMVGLKINKTQLNISERCVVPKPNPLFKNMMAMMDYYFTKQITKQTTKHVTQEVK